MDNLDRDEGEELGQTYASIDNQDSFVRLVGEAFLEAYHRDEDFKKVVENLYSIINSRRPKNEFFWIADVVNMWLMSSYHQAMVAELLFSKAKENSQNPFLYDGLIRVQHDTADCVIHSLMNCYSMLTNGKYASALGASTDSVDAIFSRNFPCLKEVRNALAHEDDRVMPIKHLSEPVGALSALTMQHKAQAGHTIWGIRSKDRKTEFRMSFKQADYFNLVTELQEQFAGN